MTSSSEIPDYAPLFAALPARLLILQPDAPRFTIVTASDAYLEATGTRLSDLRGRGIFEVFPDDPVEAPREGPANDGPAQLRASLLRVHAGHVTDRLPMLRYDIPRLDGNGFEERYWTPINSPVFGADGRLLYIVHRVEDATEFMRSARRGQEQRESLEQRLRGVEAELLLHADQLEQTNRQLALREAELSAVFNQAPLFQGLIALDGTFLRGNELALGSTGHTAAQQVGVKCWDTGWWNGSPQAQDFIRSAVTRASQGETTRARTDFFLADGARQRGDFCISPVRDASGKVVLVYATGRDCTDETLVQEALAASEHRFRSLVSNIAGMVYRVQAVPPWHFLYVSDGVERLTGYPASYFLEGRRPWASVVLLEDGERVAAELAEQARLGKAFRVEYRIRHRDGSERWVEGRVRPVEGTPDVFEGTVFDIDDRKRAAEHLRESQEHYAYTVQTVPSVLWTANADGALDFVSDASARIVGARAQDLVDEGWTRILHPDERERAFATWHEAVLQGAPYDVRFRMRVASGEYHWFQNRATPRRDADGRIVRWYGISTDVEDIVQAQTRAEQATRAKSAFLSTMSHEIRTPLNAVLGFAGLMVDTELNSQQRDFVQSIRASGDHLLGVINDILDFSKLESGAFALDFAPCDLRAMIESALDLVASQAGTKNLELLYSIDADVPPACVVDEARLRQALVNLLGNAVKFTPSGEVLVKLSARALAADEYEFEFSVRDTGIGIPADRIHRLFRDFSQVDDSITRRFGGTGLGLAITRRLIEAHGGVISVESQPGAGSTFRFRLPAMAAQQPVAVTPPSAEELRGRRVLIVDDNRSNLDILTLQLRAWGIEAVSFQHASKVPEAYANALAQGDAFDLAILDHQMPELDGLSLARALHAQSSIPIILLSSLGTGMEDARRARANLTATLTKPVHRSALLDAIGAAIRPAPRPAAAAPQPSVVDAVPPLRLLLAEDNAVNRKVALLLLRKLGYPAPDLAADGLEAVAAVAAQSYDVVLMDVQMPNLDGLDASRRIRAEMAADHQPYIIAMTANALAEDRELCLASGMDDHVAKPIDVAVLGRALLKAAAHRGIAVPAEPARRPTPREDADYRARHISEQVLAGGGEAGALMRSKDWSQTPLGPVYTWPQSLRTALSILLSQKHPIFLWWGRELVSFYNDAYRPILGQTKHPQAMGQPGRECFAEIWDQIGGMIEGAFDRGESSVVERGLLCLDRNGHPEEAYFTYSYSPMRDESGGVGGIFVACHENTVEVLATRRGELLVQLDDRATGGAVEAWERVRKLVEGATSDLPFCLLYRLDEDAQVARLVGATGLHAGSPNAPAVLRSDDATWPVFETCRAQNALLHPLRSPAPVLAPWPEPVTRAILHPLGRWGVLVIGMSPRLPDDEAYRNFLFRFAQRVQRLQHVLPG